MYLIRIKFFLLSSILYSSGYSKSEERSSQSRDRVSSQLEEIFDTPMCKEKTSFYGKAAKDKLNEQSDNSDLMLVTDEDTKINQTKCKFSYYV